MIQILIKNVPLREPSRKNTEVSPCGAFILYVVHETFIEVPIFQETSQGLKNFWLRTWKQKKSVNVYPVKEFNS